MRGILLAAVLVAVAAPASAETVIWTGEVNVGPKKRPEFSCEVRQDGTVLVATLRGHLDIYAAKGLKEKITAGDGAGGAGGAGRGNVHAAPAWRRTTIKTIVGSALVLCGALCTASSVSAQTPVGTLAVDEDSG